MNRWRENWKRVIAGVMTATMVISLVTYDGFCVNASNLDENESTESTVLDTEDTVTDVQTAEEQAVTMEDTTVTEEAEAEDAAVSTEEEVEEAEATTDETVAEEVQTDTAVTEEAETTTDAAVTEETDEDEVTADTPSVMSDDGIALYASTYASAGNFTVSTNLTEAVLDMGKTVDFNVSYTNPKGYKGELGKVEISSSDESVATWGNTEWYDSDDYRITAKAEGTATITVKNTYSYYKTRVEKKNILGIKTYDYQDWTTETATTTITVTVYNSNKYSFTNSSISNVEIEYAVGTAGKKGGTVTNLQQMGESAEYTYDSEDDGALLIFVKDDTSSNTSKVVINGTSYDVEDISDVTKKNISEKVYAWWDFFKWFGSKYLDVTNTVLAAKDAGYTKMICVKNMSGIKANDGKGTTNTISVNATATGEVKYDINGGSTWAGHTLVDGVYTDTNKCFNGASITLATGTPVRTGYHFLGWSTDASATVGSSAITYQTTNNILYAIWSKNSYAVHFVFTGGKTTEDCSVLYEETVAASDIPTPVSDEFDYEDDDYNYVFTGWDADPATTAITGETTFTAQYTKVAKVNVVIYGVEEADKADATSITTLKVKKGTAASDVMEQVNVYLEENADQLPIKEGYTFEGFYQEGTRNYFLYQNSGRTVTGWVNLYAKFSANKNTITYIDEDGTELGTATAYSGTTFGAASAPTTKTGDSYTKYDLTGWTDEEGNVVSEDAVILSDMTVTASYDVYTYATFYNKLPNGSYIKLGTGRLNDVSGLTTKISGTNKRGSEDADVVAEYVDLENSPLQDIDAETYSFAKIVKENDGWHIDVTIDEVDATFYLLKSTSKTPEGITGDSSSNYTKLGTGVIAKGATQTAELDVLKTYVNENDFSDELAQKWAELTKTTVINGEEVTYQWPEVFRATYVKNEGWHFDVYVVDSTGERVLDEDYCYIAFCEKDGTIIGVQRVVAGETLGEIENTAAELEETKDDENTYSYTFAGWEYKNAADEVVTVDDDTVISDLVDEEEMIYVTAKYTTTATPNVSDSDDEDDTTPADEEDDETPSTPVDEEDDATPSTPVDEEDDATPSTPVDEEDDVTPSTPVDEEDDTTPSTSVDSEDDTNPSTSTEGEDTSSSTPVVSDTTTTDGTTTTTDTTTATVTVASTGTVTDTGVVVAAGTTTILRNTATPTVRNTAATDTTDATTDAANDEVTIADEETPLAASDTEVDVEEDTVSIDDEATPLAASAKGNSLATAFVIFGAILACVVAAFAVIFFKRRKKEQNS